MKKTDEYFDLDNAGHRTDKMKDILKTILDAYNIILIADIGQEQNIYLKTMIFKTFFASFFYF